MAPICVPCQRFYRPEKNGFYFLEGMPIQPSVNIHVAPGKSMEEYWKPYKLWCGDLWKCEGCGHLTIVGVAREPMNEHYMDHFKEHAEKYCTKYKDLPYPYQVNDCC